jgi:hypothetical protein
MVLDLAIKYLNDPEVGRRAYLIATSGKIKFIPGRTAEEALMGCVEVISKPTMTSVTQLERKNRFKQIAGLNASTEEIEFFAKNSNYTDLAFLSTTTLYALAWVKAKYVMGDDVFTFH